MMALLNLVRVLELQIKTQAMVDAREKDSGEGLKGAFQTSLANTARSILPGGDYLQKRDIHTSESALETELHTASNLLTNSDKFETTKLLELQW